MNNKYILVICPLRGKLTWSAHLDYIAENISSALEGLIRARPYIPVKTLILIYQALVQPLFYYCYVVWENINKGLTERLQKLQNRSVKLGRENGRKKGFLLSY